MLITSQTPLRLLIAFTTLSLFGNGSAEADEAEPAATAADVLTPPTTASVESTPAAAPRPAPVFRPPESELAKSD
ncbi:unnamed protein product, partial [marine sediment metagenome]